MARRSCSRCSSARAPRVRWWRSRSTRSRSSRGGNAAALALLAAWAAPDLLAPRSDAYYEGDLLGAAALAALLLALPFACCPEASWLAGVIGAALGLAGGARPCGRAARRSA